MKIKSLILSAVFLSQTVFANGDLTFLKVDENVVSFVVNSSKTHTSPSCMLQGNSDRWTISLVSPSGKAIYALLVTAAAEKRKVVVTPANDCADKEGFERARAVELLASQDTSSGNSSASLWKEVAIAEDSKGAWGRFCTILLNSSKDGVDYLTRDTYTSSRDPDADYARCMCNNGSKKVLKSASSTVNTVSCLISN